MEVYICTNIKSVWTFWRRKYLEIERWLMEKGLSEMHIFNFMSTKLVRTQMSSGSVGKVYLTTIALLKASSPGWLAMWCAPL